MDGKVEQPALPGFEKLVEKPEQDDAAVLLTLKEDLLKAREKLLGGRHQACLATLDYTIDALENHLAEM